MKTLLIILLMSTILASDEMSRVQSIVDDIASLRAQNETCQKELKSRHIKSSNDENTLKLQEKLRDSKQKNELLLSKIDILSSKNTNNIALENKLEKLEKIIINQEISLKSKEKTIKTLKNNKVKTKEKLNNPLKTKEVCKIKNEFPRLVMKDESLNIKKEIEEEVEENIRVTTQDTQKTQIFKASAFRFKNNANVYDSIDGKKKYIWEAQTSFTSNEKNDEWVKITGYFIDKKWLKSKEELWVKHKDVFQR